MVAVASSFGYEFTDIPTKYVTDKQIKAVETERRFRFVNRKQLKFLRLDIEKVYKFIYL